MSIKLRHVDFEKRFPRFRAALATFFTPEGTVGISGMKFTQAVYDYCCAYPTPHSAKLFAGIADLLTEEATKCRDVIQQSPSQPSINQYQHQHQHQQHQHQHQHQQQQQQDQCIEVNKTPPIIANYVSEWTRYSTASYYLDLVCDFLNRNIAPSATHRPMTSSTSGRVLPVAGTKYLPQTILSLSHLIWRQIVLDSLITQSEVSKFITQVLNVASGPILADQNLGIDKASAAIKSIIELDEEHPHLSSIYDTTIESMFLNLSGHRFAQDALSAISECTIPEYLLLVESRLASEEKRCRLFCHIKTAPKLLELFVENYIAGYAGRFRDEFRGLLDEKRLDDCARIYMTLRHVDGGLDPLVAQYGDAVSKLANEAIVKCTNSSSSSGGGGGSDGKSALGLIESLIDLHQQLIETTGIVFKGDASFVAAMDRSFKNASNSVNLNKSEGGGGIAEILAKYCDVRLLRKETKPSQTQLYRDSEYENKCDKVIALFQFVDDKDVFLKCYSRYLARRLVYDNSTSLDNEAGFIAKLRNICGGEYTSKLQRMFTDIGLSSDVMNAFNDHMQSSSAISPDEMHGEFNVLVLTAGSWPIQPPSASGGTQLVIPTELSLWLDRFASFYMGRHNGRRLAWIWPSSRVDVTLTYLKRRYDVTMSMHQFVILSQFQITPNDAALTAKDIASNTGLSSEDEVAKHAAPLVESDNNTTQYALNYSFSSQRHRIKIPPFSQHHQQQRASKKASSRNVADKQQLGASGDAADTTEDAEPMGGSRDVRKGIDIDRSMYLEATITRILKTSKTLTHTALFQRVIQEAEGRFVPSVQLFKQACERLIDRGYIERDPNAQNIFLYIA
ncbi:Cullin-domain-containing protein [Ramicandelaber brevisporus]|nr:Cullin-domain-containing protein [Ramicandelaber brevisporus]